MNAPLVTPATIRGRAALDEVRALFDQLYLIDDDIAKHENPPHNAARDAYPFGLTDAEIRDVLQRRRDAVINDLLNKGIRIAPDPQPIEQAA